MTFGSAKLITNCMKYVRLLKRFVYFTVQIAENRVVIVVMSYSINLKTHCTIYILSLARYVVVTVQIAELSSRIEDYKRICIY